MALVENRPILFSLVNNHRGLRLHGKSARYGADDSMSLECLQFTTGGVPIGERCGQGGRTLDRGGRVRGTWAPRADRSGLQAACGSRPRGGHGRT